MTFEIAVVAALLLVPGVGAALAFAAPGAISIEMRIALAFGLGYGIVAGSAALLALAHVFTRPVVRRNGRAGHGWPSGLVALRRASPRAHLTALREPGTEGALRPRGRPGAAPGRRRHAAALPGGERAWPSARPGGTGPTPWRRRQPGHVPALTQQWGTEFPATVSKVVLNSFGGGVSMLLGPDPLPAMQAILVVTTVGIVAALLALGRELGLGVFAPLLPVLVVLVPEWLPLPHEITNDLTYYTAEDIGRWARSPRSSWGSTPFAGEAELLPSSPACCSPWPASPTSFPLWWPASFSCSTCWASSSWTAAS